MSHKSQDEAPGIDIWPSGQTSQEYAPIFLLNLPASQSAQEVVSVKQDPGGQPVGRKVGQQVGIGVGFKVGHSVGFNVGLAVGIGREGVAVGIGVGKEDTGLEEG